MVVTDDRIETIVDAFVEGRAMWASVRKALGILLGGNLGEIAFVLATTLLTNDRAGFGGGVGPGARRGALVHVHPQATGVQPLG